MSTTIYYPPSLQKFEPKRTVFSTWIDHISFAYDLVAAIRPQLIVELGVYNGLSRAKKIVLRRLQAAALGVTRHGGAVRGYRSSGILEGRLRRTPARMPPTMPRTTLFLASMLCLSPTALGQAAHSQEHTAHVRVFDDRNSIFG